MGGARARFKSKPRERARVCAWVSECALPSPGAGASRVSTFLPLVRFWRGVRWVRGVSERPAGRRKSKTTTHTHTKPIRDASRGFYSRVVATSRRNSVRIPELRFRTGALISRIYHQKTPWSFFSFLFLTFLVRPRGQKITPRPPNIPERSSGPLGG